MTNKTLCEHCVFKIEVNGHQTGCKLNRLSVLPHHTEGNFEVVDTFCSACRNVYWKAAQTKKDDEHLIKKIKEEIQLQFDAIILFEPEDSKDDLLFTLNKIKLKPYTMSNVYILGNMSRDTEILFRDVASNFGKNYNFTMSSEDKLSLKIASVIPKVKSSYLMFINPGYDYDENVLNDFNLSVNEVCKPKILYASGDYYICPTFLYKNFMYESHPFQKINEYVQSIATSEHSNS